VLSVNAGYGHIAPKTKWGRLITIVYAVIGIPLTFLYLSNIGNFMADCFRWFYKRICCDVCCCQQCARKHKKVDFFIAYSSYLLLIVSTIAIVSYMTLWQYFDFGFCYDFNCVCFTCYLLLLTQLLIRQRIDFYCTFVSSCFLWCNIYSLEFSDYAVFCVFCCVFVCFNKKCN